MFPLRDDAPRLQFPYVNTTLIVVNVVMFVHEVQLPTGYLNHVFIPQYGLVPARLAMFLQGVPLPAERLWVPIFSSMFLHGGWFHLLGNMWMLYLFGDNVEDVFGHGGYLAFYLGCGVVAAMTQVALSLNSHTPTIGASGAIAGVMGAYLIKFPRARVLTLVFLVFFFFFWDLPAWVILGYWFVIQFLSSAAALGMSASSDGGVAVFAHVGGFIAGAILVMLVSPGSGTRHYGATATARR